MNAPLLPEVVLSPQRDDQPALPLATEGMQRFVWQSAFGPILIEAHDGAAFVNGQRVMSMAEMHEASPAPAAAATPLAQEATPRR